MGIRLVEYGKSIFPLRVACPHCQAVMEIENVSSLINDVGWLDNICTCKYCHEDFKPLNNDQKRRVDLERRGMVRKSKEE